LTRETVSPATEVIPTLAVIGLTIGPGAGARVSTGVLWPPGKPLSKASSRILPPLRA
jgi:hypothetical protein